MTTQAKDKITALTFPEIQSCFAKYKDRFATYRAVLRFRGRLVGGVPKDPKVIEAWIKSKIANRDAEYITILQRSLEEMGYSSTDNPSLDDVEEASKEMAMLKHTMGFKRDEQGQLFIEGRQVKSMLKECANIALDGKLGGHNSTDRTTGQTKIVGAKLAKSYIAERVFINPDHILLGVNEPTGIDMSIAHVMGPRGPQNSLSYYEYVENAVIEIEAIAWDDCLSEKQWGAIWALAEDNGLGAMRSQGYGRFTGLSWTKVE